MNDYRDTIRLARDVDAIRTELERVTTREQVDALHAKVDALHLRVADAIVAHRATQPWYSRWLWSLRLWNFNRATRRKAGA